MLCSFTLVLPVAVVIIAGSFTSCYGVHKLLFLTSSLLSPSEEASAVYLGQLLVLNNNAYILRLKLHQQYEYFNAFHISFWQQRDIVLSVK